MNGRARSDNPEVVADACLRLRYSVALLLTNPTPATILCIQNRCQPKKTRCRKASGLFCTHFSQCNFGRCQTPKMPCGWDLNLNNRLFRGDFAIFQSPGLPFFRLFQKNICKLFMSKTRIVEYFSAVLFFIFKKGDT